MLSFQSITELHNVDNTTIAAAHTFTTADGTTLRQAPSQGL